MKLLVGLGNPGKQYELTRHNAGFLALDILKKKLNADSWSENKKFSALLSSAIFNEEKVILAKPVTFMNLSGTAIRALSDYYKIKPEDIWVFHDDADLPLGKLRIGHFNSAGGHNGLKSLQDHLLNDNFLRFRLGIGKSTKPEQELKDFVLEKFSTDEKQLLNNLLDQAATACILALEKPLPEVLNKYN